MAGFKGEPEQFATAHTNVADTKAQMDSNIQMLRSNIEATAGMWEGPAAALFQQLMERFNEKSSKLNMALEDIGELLKQSGLQYQGSEERVSETVNKLTAAAEDTSGLAI